VQPETSSAIFAAQPTQAAWHSKPSWEIVASEDRMMAPERQASMTKLAKLVKLLKLLKLLKATATSLPSSHVVMLSHPKEVAKVIEDAAAGAK